MQDFLPLLVLCALAFLAAWLSRTRAPPKGVPAARGSPVVLRLSPTDFISIDAAMQGMLCFGGTGAGKTTAFLVPVLENLIRLGYGVLVLCAKRTDAPTAEAIARACGREGDVRRIGAGTKWRMDVLQVACSVSVNNAVYLLEILMEIGQRKQAKAEDPFWLVGAQRVVKRALFLLYEFRSTLGEPSLRMVENVINSAPLGDLSKDPLWCEDSDCWELLQQAKKIPKPNEELRRSIQFFETDWPNLAEKTRTSLLAVVQNTLDRLLSSDVAAAVASGKTTVHPRDLESGAIIICDLPPLSMAEAGILGAISIKTVVLRHLLARAITPDSLPVAIVTDECQLFLHSGLDAAAAAVSRSQKIVSVVATQNVPGVIATLGEHARMEIMQYVANHQTLIFFQNSEMVETNALAAKIFGEHQEFFLNISSGGDKQQHDPVGEFLGSPQTNITVSLNTTIRPVVPPELFASLRQGGPPHFTAQAVVYSGGRRFSNGLPYIIVDLPQRLIEEKPNAPTEPTKESD